jgi:copper chaperone CopZ
MKTTLTVSGMTCGGCTNMVKVTLEKHPGVQSVSVSLDPPEAVIEAGDSITPAELLDYLHENTHYKATITG